MKLIFKNTSEQFGGGVLVCFPPLSAPYQDLAGGFVKLLRDDTVATV